MVKPGKNSRARTGHLIGLGAGLVGSYLAYQFQRPFLGEEGGQVRRRALRPGLG